MHDCHELDQLIDFAAEHGYRIGLRRIGIDQPAESPRNEEWAGSLGVMFGTRGAPDYAGGYAVPDTGTINDAARTALRHLEALVRERETA